MTSGYNVGGDLFRITPPADADGKFEVKQVYHTDDMEVHIGGVVLVDGHLYGISDSFLTCIDFLTGKRVWKDRSVGKGAVIYADGLLYLLSENGVVGLAEATPEGYRERGRFRIPQDSLPTWSHPIVVGGHLILRDQDTVYAYDVRQKK